MESARLCLKKNRIHLLPGRPTFIPFRRRSSASALWVSTASPVFRLLICSESEHAFQATPREIWYVAVRQRIPWLLWCWSFAVCLSVQFPTPIHRWDLPGLAPGTELWVKVRTVVLNFVEIHFLFLHLDSFRKSFWLLRNSCSELAWTDTKVDRWSAERWLDRNAAEWKQSPQAGVSHVRC